MSIPIKHCSINKQGKYEVRKSVNGELTYFGVVDNYYDAQRFVDALKSINWDVNLLPEEFKKYLPLKRGHELRYITRLNTGYRVTKNLNGKTYFFGIWPTEEEAKEAISKLIEHDWSITYFKQLYKPIKMKRTKKKKIKQRKKNQRKKEVNGVKVGSLSNPIYSNEKPTNTGSIESTYNKKYGGNN
ncbi:MAG: hypothetical protein IJH63_10285 [Methanobrevibacter sp.]|nr:hypothetical protein [Methanosphaera sp.]MBR0371087.1 hypothetical protein [Methanobrevibacter sp.]